MENVDEEWTKFLTKPNDHAEMFKKNINSDIDNVIPECEELYISTQTKVLYLNKEVDIFNTFWKIPIINYWEPVDGIIKKQMKIICKSPEEIDEYQSKLTNIQYYTENILKQINTSNAKETIYKDERKITIGISKKDIMNCRGKVKNAFYNCFALIIRFKYKNVFKEIHVKIFNTGKLEIPGVLNDQLFSVIKTMILSILRNYNDSGIHFIEKSGENNNVLINSNFNCGFYINRDNLHNILKSEKYNIETSYDPCSYPGVKCKYYYNNDIIDINNQTGQISLEDRNMKLKDLNINKKYTEISFMIFRTGSCLIVGNCNKNVLNVVYNFIKQLLYNEYSNIYVKNDEITVKTKKNKIRKKIIQVTC